MIEHPLPQNITAYQFHLIGNMTVKQFLILLVGVGIGFAFYQTNLPFVVKWFFIIFFGILATATAFVPYESRTLDQWLWNFVRAIYRPTKFYWTRKVEVPAFFAYTQRPDVRNQQQQFDITPYKRQQVRQYLSSLGRPSGAPVDTDPLDIFTQRSSQIDELFTNVQAARDVDPAEYEQVIKPNLQVRARPLRPQKLHSSSTVAATGATPVAPPQQHSSAVKAASLSPVLEPQNQAQVQTETRAHVAPQEILKVAPTPDQATTPESATSTISSLAPENQGDVQMYAQSVQSENIQTADGTVPAVFSTDLPFPSLPDKPNLLVGMVHDPEHKIVSGAIVEILDSNGNTVRAMKTNALGQFYISSPLPNGKYHIETEKDGLSFPVYSFEATGTPLAPVDVQSAAATAPIGNVLQTDAPSQPAMA